MEVTTECVVKIKAARVNRCLKAKIFFSSLFHVLNSQHILQNEWQVSTKISGSMCCLPMCFSNLFLLWSNQWNMGWGGGEGDCTHLKCTFGRVVALHPSAPHLWWDYPSSEYPRSRSMESQRSHIPKKTSTHTGTRTFVCYLIVVCTEVKKIFQARKDSLSASAWWTTHFFP